MARFRLSRRAEDDLLSIAAYTLETWGEDQAIRYLAQIEACCRTLAENPRFGRKCDEVRTGLRRAECGLHVLFYREDAGGILVSRILHQRMLPDRHAMDQDSGQQGA